MNFSMNVEEEKNLKKYFAEKKVIVCSKGLKGAPSNTQKNSATFFLIIFQHS